MIILEGQLMKLITLSSNIQNHTLTCLWTKVLRYRSILDQGDEMNFDNARDTLMDIVNYAARAHAYMDLYWIEDDEVSPPAL